MKFVLLSLMGALIYHAIQVQNFLARAPRGFTNSFLDLFLKTVADPSKSAALSGPVNLLIGGAIGCGIALIVHFLQPRRSTGEPGSGSRSDNGTTNFADLALVAAIALACVVGLWGAFKLTRGSLTAGAQEQQATESAPISVGDLSGEWFDGYSDGRSLRLRGALYNFEDSGESFVHLQCSLVLRLHFKSDREPAEIEGSTCGFLGSVRRGESATFDDISSAEVGRQWLDYGVLRAELRIRISAENPFGERFVVELPWTEIPNPSTRTRFAVKTTP